VHVEQWMTRKVHCTRLMDSIRHAREIMATHRVNQLPVVVDGKVVGIITDRDVRDAFPSVFDRTTEGLRRPPKGADPDKITVEMVMTANVLTLAPKDSVAEAARRMRKERIGALPVVDNGHLVGILARSDLLDALVALAERA
jgi:acetoin utilization protein AcuB